MRPIPSNIVRALEIEVPQFVNAVNRNQVGEVELSWIFFEGRPDLLYNCVWYAASKGQIIVIQ